MFTLLAQVIGIVGKVIDAGVSAKNYVVGKVKAARASNLAKAQAINAQVQAEAAEDTRREEAGRDPK